MPTLKDLSLMTSEVDRIGGELHAELTEGEIDFERMVELADGLSEKADKLAAAFNTMSEALRTTLNDSDESAGDGGADDEQG